ncbi:MAG: MraY family glycosyltransferase, partial [Patescibacteria group bacterium]
MSTAFVWFPQLAVLTLISSAVLSWALAGLIRRLALRQGFVDHPEAAPQRKVHTAPVPLLGGLALFGGFALTSVFLWNVLTAGYLLPKHLLGLLLAGAVLMIGGAWDDIKNLKPSRQILFPLLACVIVVASGVDIHEITNPFGDTLSLETISWIIFTWQDIPYRLVLWADLFGILWLLATTYATKFLDGLDGLVAGVTAIGASAIAVLSYRAPVLQPETALVALCLAGAAVGFLIWNRHPAKIFLGESGSLFCGFALGVLAIISGGKIAIALLVLGVPLLDAAWVIFKRLRSGHSPFVGDSEHLHQRLFKLGLT